MGNGISLNKLIDTLGADSFATTQKNAARGEGNTDPRAAYRRQPYVELSAEGLSKPSEWLQEAFDSHGKIPQEDLDKLDWPDTSSTGSMNRRAMDDSPHRPQSQRASRVTR